MWCAQCRSDVATEVAADGQSLLCTTCGSEVRKTFAPSLHPDVRRARDVLARLTRENAETRTDADEDATPAQADAPIKAASERIEAKTEPPVGSSRSATPRLVKPDAAHETEGSLNRATRDDSEEAGTPVFRGRPQRQFRVDAAHPADAVHAHVSPAQNAGRGRRPEPVAPNGIMRREDDAHAVIPPPHFDVTAARGKPPGRSESTWGQLLAYVGVAVLTIGTALVLWGYFGGPAAYAPTGWLVTTAGQMLLLLGVITLVSGGMQQTTHEVATRVAHLDGRMHRIETTAHELLHGPHFRQSVRRAGSASDADGGLQTRD
jgi:hypothetical protein